MEAVIEAALRSVDELSRRNRELERMRVADLAEVEDVWHRVLAFLPADSLFSVAAVSSAFAWTVHRSKVRGRK